MTGQEDIEATCFVLADRIRAIGEGVPPLVILPIYSQLAADQQAKVRCRGGCLKIGRYFST
jgi:pre-mRNA-splicing factor ATP-dependent RNA helicase DHX38/PRP16